MKTAEFDYHLPEELIAQVPAAHRDESRLLVVHRESRALEHRRFRDLPAFLRAGDCLFRNVARVLPARLAASRPGGGHVECLLLRPEPGSPLRWWCLLRPGRKLRPGATFAQAGEFAARVLGKSPGAEYLVEFSPALPDETVAALAERIGVVPLPPYIRRDDETSRGGSSADAGAPPSAQTAVAALDRERYQTVFANPSRTVAVAAPTAGLHFTQAMLDGLRHAGVGTADLVLHVGLGTFRPMDGETVEEHPIHREAIEVPAATRALLDGWNGSGRRVAVGTTSVRTLEYYARRAGDVPAAAANLPGPFRAEADLFVYPPFAFRSVDALVTNFHLPRSTLLCLVAAFLTPGSTDGAAWLRELYAEAVRQRYRFLSYGDAMLIL